MKTTTNCHGELRFDKPHRNNTLRGFLLNPLGTNSLIFVFVNRHLDLKMTVNDADSHNSNRRWVPKELHRAKIYKIQS